MLRPESSCTTARAARARGRCMPRVCKQLFGDFLPVRTGTARFTPLRLPETTLAVPKASRATAACARWPAICPRSTSMESKRMPDRRLRVLRRRQAAGALIRPCCRTRDRARPAAICSAAVPGLVAAAPPRWSIVPRARPGPGPRAAAGRAAPAFDRGLYGPVRRLHGPVRRRSRGRRPAPARGPRPWAAAAAGAVRRTSARDRRA
jgi:hypothetical protein